jgi:hypothetical protein
VADTDTRTFRKYLVSGSAEIRDGRTEKLAFPGDVVELTEESRVVMIRQPNGLEPFEIGGTNVNALLYGGFIEEIPEDTAPAKAEKKA